MTSSATICSALLHVNITGSQQNWREGLCQWATGAGLMASVMNLNDSDSNSRPINLHYLFSET